MWRREAFGRHDLLDVVVQQVRVVLVLLHAHTGNEREIVKVRRVLRGHDADSPAKLGKAFASDADGLLARISPREPVVKDEVLSLAFDNDHPEVDVRTCSRLVLDDVAVSDHHQIVAVR